MIMSADQRAVLVSDTIETEDWFSPPQIDDSKESKKTTQHRGPAVGGPATGEHRCWCLELDFIRVPTL